MICKLRFPSWVNENALAAVALGGLRGEVSEANETYKLPKATDCYVRCYVSFFSIVHINFNS